MKVSFFGFFHKCLLLLERLEVLAGRLRAHKTLLLVQLHLRVNLLNLLLLQFGGPFLNLL